MAAWFDGRYTAASSMWRRPVVDCWGLGRAMALGSKVTGCRPNADPWSARRKHALGTSL